MYTDMTMAVNPSSPMDPTMFASGNSANRALKMRPHAGVEAKPSKLTVESSKSTNTITDADRPLVRSSPTT